MIIKNPCGKNMVFREICMVMNPNLMNGVYDFNIMKFRISEPSDMLSTSIRFDYPMLYTSNHPYVLRCKRIMTQFFPDFYIRRYFLLQLARTFIGGNSNKSVFFWTGVGNNGKTVLQSWLECLFGEYTLKVRTSLLCGKPIVFGAPNHE